MLGLYASFMVATLLTISVYAHSVWIDGKAFAFQIKEPKGWILDFHSAAQIANFVMHEEGTTWRAAGALVSVRFFEKTGDDLKSFVDQEFSHLAYSCPFFETEQLPTLPPAVPGFDFMAFECSPQRHELVAVTELPDHFAVFSLSCTSVDYLRKVVPVFEQALLSFQWLGALPAENAGR